MKLRAGVVFPSDRLWRLGAVEEDHVRTWDIPMPETASVEEQIQRFQDQTMALGIEPAEVVLAIPSAWCMSASFELNGIATKNSKALLYALEEHLPIVAEEVLAGFTCKDGKAFAVCTTQRGKVTSLLDGLKANGWSVLLTTPAPLLALSRWLSPPVDRMSVDLVLAAEGDQWVLLALEQGRVKSWHVLPADVQDLQHLLQMLTSQREKPSLNLVSAALPSTIQALEGASQVSSSELPLADAAALAADAVLAGRGAAMIDLSPPAHRRSLARRLHCPLKFAAVSFALLLLSLIVAQLTIAWRMDHQTDLLDGEQADLFQQGFPQAHRGVPRQLARYLASEQQRLAASDQSAQSQQSMPALQMLRDLLTRFPQPMPIKLMRLRIESDQAELVGQVLSHEDAGRLAAALGADGAFVVQPSQTTVARDQGVNFTLQLRRPSASSHLSGGQP